MYWFRFRRTSPWGVGNGVFKAFFYTSPPLREIEAFADTAVASYTRAQLEALVTAAKEALAAWPQV